MGIVRTDSTGNPVTIAGGCTTADFVDYDNTGTGLQAASVQDAINELNNNLDNSLIIRPHEVHFDINAQSVFATEINLAYNGYTPMAISGYAIYAASARCFVCQATIDNNKLILAIGNYMNTNVSGAFIRINILYKKNK